MKLRKTRARICAVISTSLFSAIAFAQASPVSDRLSLEGTDSIEWQNQGVAVGFELLSDQVLTNAGEIVLVTKTLSTPSYVDIGSSSELYNANFADDDYVLDTANYVSILNYLTFEYLDGRDFCGLGTQISPTVDSGNFYAQIEAFDENGATMGVFPFSGTNSTGVAPFIGIKSVSPMKSVVLTSYSNTGSNKAAYAINQVDLKDCASAPKLSCEGFAAPMANYPVKLKKNRAFPLKMELFDESGIEQTNIELVAAPVVSVMFTASETEDALDVSGDTLAAGQATAGNQFDFNVNGLWQFNLKSNDFTASGTYLVTVVSGDESEYVIDSSCVTSFVTQ